MKNPSFFMLLFYWQRIPYGCKDNLICKTKDTRTFSGRIGLWLDPNEKEIVFIPSQTLRSRSSRPLSALAAGTCLLAGRRHPVPVWKGSPFAASPCPAGRRQ